MNETMTKSSQRFPLSDLLSVPMQRILKYPLLLKVCLSMYKRAYNASSIMLVGICADLECLYPVGQELLKCAEKKIPRNSADLANLTAVHETLQVSAVNPGEVKSPGALNATSLVWRYVCTHCLQILPEKPVTYRVLDFRDLNLKYMCPSHTYVHADTHTNTHTCMRMYTLYTVCVYLYVYICSYLGHYMNCIASLEISIE